MKLLGIDLETTGLDFEKDRITEIGAVLWDTDRKTPLEMMSNLIECLDRPAITPEITKLTHIDEGMLRGHGIQPSPAFTTLSKMFEKADYIVAHNGINFDKPMLLAEYTRQNRPLIPRTWIDTKTDVPYPPEISTRRLNHLRADHGLSTNTFAHRALFDAIACVELLCLYDLAIVTVHAASPTILIRSHTGFAERELPKARRYFWDPESREWRKHIKDFQLEAEIREAPFRVTVVEEKK